MSKLTWDDTGKRLFETGTDRGVLYPQVAGLYPVGVAWNGLTAVTESPSGAEATPVYADNKKYLNLLSAEEFGCTIEAVTYPDEFGPCDGTAAPYPGVTVGQQGRQSFGFAFRTLVGNDVSGTDLGYKIKLVYGGLAQPSEKANATVNDSPETVPFSWEVTTTKVAVPGYKDSALLVIDSTKVDATKLAALELVLYGDVAVAPRLPLPAEVFTLIGTVLTDAIPVMPAYVLGTHTITIPVTTGIDYQIDGVTKVAGAVVITKDTVVKAVPKATYKLKAGVDDDFFYSFT
jgi:hypothetical protein